MQTTASARVCLVGYGYWGPNLLRNLVQHGGFEVVGVVDSDERARKLCAKCHPSIPLYETAEEMLFACHPGAVLIATPPSTHACLAIQCLKAGTDVLLEKPMALSVAECDSILRAAKSADKKVMIDHTFVYHPAIQYLRKEIDKGTLGELLYYDSVRVNWGGYQPCTNVLWDLAPHDLSILDCLLKAEQPVSVSVMASHHFGKDHADLGYAHLVYPNGFTAHLHLNWVAPVKIRSIILGGTLKMVVYDDILVSEKVRVYDKGLIVNSVGEGQQLRVNYRIGDMLAPALPSQEALAFMLSAFHRYITEGEKPFSDGASGRRMVQVLEVASQSMKEGGAPIELRPHFQREKTLAA